MGSRGRGMRALRKLTPGARRDLLRVLTSPSNVRADVIRQFYERPDGAALAETLIDLEADEMLRVQVIEALEESLSDERPGQLAR